MNAKSPNVITAKIEQGRPIIKFSAQNKQDSFHFSFGNSLVLWSSLDPTINSKIMNPNFHEISQQLELFYNSVFCCQKQSNCTKVMKIYFRDIFCSNQGT